MFEKSSLKLIGIGYWISCYELDLPDPKYFVDENWNLDERNLVIQHLRDNSVPLLSWMGFSWCRFRCGETNMGSSDLTDGQYIYPEKFVHYISEHFVKPPELFINHIYNYKKPIQRINKKAKYEIELEWWKKQIGPNKAPSKNSFLASTDEEILRFKNRATNGFME